MTDVGHILAFCVALISPNQWSGQNPKMAKVPNVVIVIGASNWIVLRTPPSLHASITQNKATTAPNCGFAIIRKSPN